MTSSPSVQPMIIQTSDNVVTSQYPAYSSFASPTPGTETVIDESITQSTVSPFQLQSTSSPSNSLTASSPSKAPNVNKFFCGITWDYHIKNCESSTPCPNGDECPPGELCFAASPCAYLSNQDDSSSTSPTSQAELVAVESFKKPTSSPSYSQIMSLSSKAPTINTFFCGITWDYHTSNCASSTPCPRGDECPSGEKCFSNSPCATLISQEDVIAKSIAGNFCSTEYKLLLTTVSGVFMGPLSVQVHALDTAHLY